jgi:uncharacterized repeat protein (TIGR03803 family)
VRRWNLSHYAISSCVTAALLGGCGGSQQPIGAPGAFTRSSTSYSYKVLLRFGSAPRRRSRGRRPAGGLLNVGGTFYGTTLGGSRFNEGTVFSMSPAGSDKILYRFLGGSQPEHPNAPLIDVGDKLYGTSTFGGGGCFNTYDAGCGTVFRVTMAGYEEVLHHFTGGCRSCDDGANPYSGLIDVNGTLYGTTSGGGRANSTSYYCCGTVYSITPGGKYKILYRFCGSSNCADGSSPMAGLIDVNGTLYGATVGGGEHDAGTVFSISTTGKEKVLYSFSGGSDGVWPYGTLISVNGTLYGTTFAGGSGSCYVNGVHGCGTVYSVSLSGTEKVLYGFAGGSDGAYPYWPLVNVNGALYGTTPFGGGGDCKTTSRPSGCGIIYEVTTAGSESVLHSFSSGTDGAFPSSGLTNVNGALFGTTSSGGVESCRYDTCGTVFTLTP